MTRKTSLAVLMKTLFRQKFLSGKNIHFIRKKNHASSVHQGEYRQKRYAIRARILVSLWLFSLGHTPVVYSNTVPGKGITPIDECNSLYKHKKITQRELDALLGLGFSSAGNTIKNDDTTSPNENLADGTIKISVNLCYADLSDLSLKNRRINYVDFTGANLSQVDFERAQIYSSVFNGAQLIKTNFRDAQISNSIFYAANMELVNFSRAIIERALFPWTYMRNALLIGSTIQQTQFSDVDLQYGNLSEAIIANSDFVNTNFRYGTMDHARFVASNARDSQFTQTAAPYFVSITSNFADSDFSSANLQNANFTSTNMIDSVFTNANLTGAQFDSVSLENAVWLHTTIDGVSLENVDANGLLFEVSSMEKVSIDLFTKARNLQNLRYENSPRALLNLRGDFKTAGLRQQEREVTYAIKKSETNLLAAQNTFASTIELYTRVILFDLPTAWGLDPNRAFNGLFWSIFLFAIPYTFVIAFPVQGRGGIWRVHQDELLNKTGTIRLHLSSIVQSFRTGFYFSILSAFQIGVREYNISDWLVRLQPNAYVLQATGWIRTLVGLQALISVFLFASWLASFARPFE